MVKKIKISDGKIINFKTNFELVDTHQIIYTIGKPYVTKDEKFLFTIQEENIKITEISTGKVVKTLLGDSELVTCSSLSPNQKIFVSASRSLTISLWDWENEKILISFKSLEGPVSSISWEKTSTLMAVGTSNGDIKIWDVEKMFVTHSFKGSQGIISTLSFLVLNTKLLLVSTASFDNIIRIWDLKTKKCICALEGHVSIIRAIVYSNCGKYMISGSRDNTIIVWNLLATPISMVATIPVMESIEGLVMVPPNVSFDAIKDKNSKDQFFITAGSKKSLKLWNLSSFETVQTIQCSKEFTELCLMPLGTQIVCVNSDQDIVFYNLANLTESRRLVGYFDEIIDAKILNSNTIVLATNSDQLRLINLDNHNCICVPGHEDIIMSVDVDITGNYLVTSSKDTNIRIWKLIKKNEQIINTVCVGYGIGHTSVVSSVCFSKKSNEFVVSVSQDFTVKIWKTSNILNISEDNPVKLKSKITVKAHKKDINCVSVSPDDKFFATASHDKTIKIWTTKDMTLQGTLIGHLKGVWHCLFSPSDKCIVSASSDKTIKLWSLHDFTCLKTFEDHTMPVLRVEFMTKGLQLVSSSSDGLIKVWTIKNNECVATLDGHSDKVWVIAKSHCESKLISAGSDSALNVWEDMSEKYLIEKNEEKKMIESEQELSNLMIEGKYLEAAQIAIKLNKPFTLLNLCKEMSTNKMTDMEKIIQKISMDDIGKILEYVKIWNTNAKHSIIAQNILMIILKTFTPSKLCSLPGIEKIIEGLLPYTERHFSRINKSLQESLFIDYTWQRMKVGNISLLNDLPNINCSNPEISFSENSSNNPKRKKLE